MGKKEAEQAVEDKKDAKAAEAPEEPKKEVSASVGKIIDAVKTMTVLELSELVKALEDEVGVISTIGRSDGHGVIVDLEVLLMEDNESKIILTGNMDNILREVVMVGISHLLCNHYSSPWTPRAYVLFI